MELINEKGVIGEHPDIPPGTLALHPKTLVKIKPLLQEGDIVEVNNHLYVLILSPLAPPPSEITPFSLLIHGEKYIPPLYVTRDSFKKYVSIFKEKEPEDKTIASYFGYYVPNAVQLAERHDYKELLEKWGKHPLPPPGVKLRVRERYGIRFYIDIHGYFRNGEYEVYQCKQGHATIYPQCHLCGSDAFPTGKKTIVRGSDLLKEIEAKEGSVGNITLLEGEGDIRRAYLRRKTNVGISPEGYSGVEIIPLPGKHNSIPKSVADYLIRVYRYISMYRGIKDVPKSHEQLIGSKLVLYDGKNAIPFLLEAVEGTKPRIRTEIFWSIPKNRLLLTVPEELDGIPLKELEKGNSFPFEMDDDIVDIPEGEKLLDMYFRLIKEMNFSTDPFLDMLSEFLEKKLDSYTSIYRCEKCGEEYARLPLKKVCIRCGGDVKGKISWDIPNIEDYVERWKHPEIERFLHLFEKRIPSSRRVSILDY